MSKSLMLLLAAILVSGCGRAMVNVDADLLEERDGKVMIELYNPSDKDMTIMSIDPMQFEVSAGSSCTVKAKWLDIPAYGRAYILVNPRGANLPYKAKVYWACTYDDRTREHYIQYTAYATGKVPGSEASKVIQLPKPRCY